MRRLAQWPEIAQLCWNLSDLNLVKFFCPESSSFYKNINKQTFVVFWCRVPPLLTIRHAERTGKVSSLWKAWCQAADRLPASGSMFQVRAASERKHGKPTGFWRTSRDDKPHRHYRLVPSFPKHNGKDKYIRCAKLQTSSEILQNCICEHLCLATRHPTLQVFYDISIYVFHKYVHGIDPHSNTVLGLRLIGSASRLSMFTFVLGVAALQIRTNFQSQTSTQKKSKVFDYTFVVLHSWSCKFVNLQGSGNKEMSRQWENENLAGDKGYAILFEPKQRWSNVLTTQQSWSKLHMPAPWPKHKKYKQCCKKVFCCSEQTQPKFEPFEPIKARVLNLAKISALTFHALVTSSKTLQLKFNMEVPGRPRHKESATKPMPATKCGWILKSLSRTRMQLIPTRFEGGSSKM